jgi:S1-C subfamily serine protease
MSAAPAEDLPEAASVVSLPLRREALLPNERGRGLGTVAVVCTMAGVASGLALATTLMAMQVADSMSTHQPAYQIEVTPVVSPAEPNMGYLGVQQVFQDGYDHVLNVWPDSPAQSVGLHVGDRMLSIDGVAITSTDDVYNRIRAMPPGTMPAIDVLRGDVTMTIHPVLASRPAVIITR